MKDIIKMYYQILSKDYPTFIDPYLKCNSLKRLAGISLFCGIDFCGLFNVKIPYSRLDHSIGVALIIWNYTKDKKATLAGLFHDISTPVFSHVIDFMYKDYLKQEKTEERNKAMILEDYELCELLKKDNINIEDIIDYKLYPIADNEVPNLSSDRLEYMYSTGLCLTNDFDLTTIKETYDTIKVGINEQGESELCFTNNKEAQHFVKKCISVGKFFQSDEDKMALEYLSLIVKEAINENIINEDDIYKYTEQEIWNLMIEKGSNILKRKIHIFKHLHTVKSSNKYIQSECCININVKKRYIDPLINTKRSSETILSCKNSIDEFIQYKDSEYAYIDEDCFKGE